MVIFHSYVSLPEGKLSCSLDNIWFKGDTYQSCWAYAPTNITGIPHLPGLDAYVVGKGANISKLVCQQKSGTPWQFWRKLGDQPSIFWGCTILRTYMNRFFISLYTSIWPLLPPIIWLANSLWHDMEPMQLGQPRHTAPVSAYPQDLTGPESKSSEQVLGIPWFANFSTLKCLRTSGHDWWILMIDVAGWCPPVISWFINPINYSYICHKP